MAGMSKALEAGREGLAALGLGALEGSGQKQLFSHLGPGALAKPGSLRGPCESTCVARTRS